MRRLTWLAIPFPVLVVLFAVGCQSRQSDTADRAVAEQGVESATVENETGKPQSEQSGGQRGREATALEAKDALFSALSGRLMEVLQADGPAAAIEVCSQEAIAIAERVGQEQGVEIGRTSFRLRNPDNAPREWARPFVEARVEEVQRVDLPDGRLGMLFPIRLDVKCLMCHGGPDDVLDAVKPELAKRYPQDQATGFQQGDLRGWFWVEVPADPATSADSPERT